MCSSWTRDETYEKEHDEVMRDNDPVQPRNRLWSLQYPHQVPEYIEEYDKCRESRRNGSRESRDANHGHHWQQHEVRCVMENQVCMEYSLLLLLVHVFFFFFFLMIFMYVSSSIAW